jgi:hypothetical protein
MGGVETAADRFEFAHNPSNSAANPQAIVPGGIAIAQFVGFELAGTGPTGNAGPAPGTRLAMDFDFDGGAAATVENLAGDQVADLGGAHGGFSPPPGHHGA